MTSALLPNLLVFGRLLRHLGISVHAARLVDAAEALLHVDVGSRELVYHALRSLLVHHREDLETFDRAFAAFWQGRFQASPDAAGAPIAALPQRGGAGPSGKAASAGVGEQHRKASSQTGLEPVAARRAEQDGADAVEIGMWSDTGGLANKDFAEFTTDEVRLAHAVLSRLTWTPGHRRTRRWTPGRGGPIDLRRALARSRRTAGEVFVLPRRARRTRPRPLVLICDISRSMDAYTRMLLHFAHALGARQHRLEVFLFATTLTRITPQLRFQQIDDAVDAVSRAVPDWSGGTRIGEALRQFHQRWGRRVLRSGAVVLLVSDGWDRGDPGLLRDQVARLQRSCHRLIWLNPLIGTADYAPLTRGLRAALPYVDDFLAVRTLSDLADLAAHLNALAPEGSDTLVGASTEPRRARPRARRPREHR